MTGASRTHAHAQLAEGLRFRRSQIRETILDHLHAMEADAPVRDAEYLRGLREAVVRGVDYGIDLMVVGELHAPPAPVALTAQARLAARQGIKLEMVVRRYVAAKTLLGRYLLDEATRIGLGDLTVIRDITAAHEDAFDRILTMATDEYEREVQAATTSPDFRLAQRVRRLLNAEPVDETLPNYDMELHHLGLVAQGPDLKPQLRRLATALGSHFLSVAISREEVWAWIGSTVPVDSREVSNLASTKWSSSCPLGIGEPSNSVAGWRRSHAQAKAAAQLAAMSDGGATRYKDVVLLASASRDPLLLESVGDVYLRPLGPKDRKTLLAYFGVDGNGSAAAAILGVSRQTVAKRLQIVEERLGQPVDACADVLHAALRLEALGLLDST